jgi:hypothetical protein
MAVLWGASFSLLLLAYMAVDRPGLGPGLGVIAALTLVVAFCLMYIAVFRAGPRQSVTWPEIFQLMGHVLGDPEDGRRRPSDGPERRAWRRLRKGQITRFEYERVMAHRRFVHGEISAGEYEEALDELKDYLPATETGRLPE